MTGKEINYLDLLIRQVGSKFKYRMYRKPNNANMYLPQDSCHPRFVFRGLLIGLRKRLQRRNPDPDDFHRELQITGGHLRARGYSKDFINHWLMRDHQLDKPKKIGRQIPFITRYTRGTKLKVIKKIIKQNWWMLRPVVLAEPSFGHRLGPSIFRHTYKYAWQEPGG